MAINISPDNPKVSMGCGCAVSRYRRLTMTDVERSTRPRDRKAQLAAVAAELFRARGFPGVGIKDIADAAGVTGPALYRHFADKQAILAYVVLSGFEDMEAATAEALSDSVLPADQLESLLGLLATQAVERREIAALWRWEGRHLPKEDQREIARRSTLALTAWSKALLVRRPELRAEDAELLCWAALSVFGSVSVHHTAVARRRFAALLVELALDVLNTTLPSPSSPPSAPAREPRHAVPPRAGPGGGDRAVRPARLPRREHGGHRRGGGHRGPERVPPLPEQGSADGGNRTPRRGQAGIGGGACAAGTGRSVRAASLGGVVRAHDPAHAGAAGVVLGGPRHDAGPRQGGSAAGPTGLRGPVGDAAVGGPPRAAGARSEDHGPRGVNDR